MPATDGLLSVEHRAAISAGLRRYYASSQARIRLGESMRGHAVSPETRAKISEAQRGERSHWWGKHLPEGARVKIGNALRGRHITPEHRAKTIQTKRSHPMSTAGREKLRASALGNKHMLGRHHTPETRAKIGDSHRGERSVNWGKRFSAEHCRKISEALRDGTAITSYSAGWTASFRRAIRERDNYTCRLCGLQQTDEAFAVHHIDYDKSHGDPLNLLTLCRGCHAKTNGNRRQWTAFFRCLVINAS